MRFVTAANMTGLPAISFPVGYTKKGLPIGLQVIGKAWDEANLLRMALAAEQVTRNLVGRTVAEVERHVLKQLGALLDRPSMHTGWSLESATGRGVVLTTTLVIAFLLLSLQVRHERTVVTVVEDDPRDENHEPLQANLERLRSMTDQDGRPLRIVTLPMPRPLAQQRRRAAGCDDDLVARLQTTADGPRHMERDRRHVGAEGDLGRVAAQVERALAEIPPPAGVNVALRGQTVPLRELLDKLDPVHFKQIHRATIVNMRAVSAITRPQTSRRAGTEYGSAFQ